MSKRKIRIPPPYPAWDGENSMDEWVARRIPCPPGMNQMDWIAQHIKPVAGESQAEFMQRVIEDPVWACTLVDVPPFRDRVNDISLEAQGRIDGLLAHPSEFFEYFRCVGRLGGMVIGHLKKMGWLGDQDEELPGRWGFGFADKNAAHLMLRELGIYSNLAMRLDGRSFFNTNTVRPNDQGRHVSQDLRDVFNPISQGPWSLMITSQTTPDKNSIAIKEHQLGYVNTNRYMTERPRWDFKWKNYQVVFFITVSQDGTICLRAWLSSERMVARGPVVCKRPRKTQVSKPVPTELNGRLVEQLKMVTVETNEDVSEYQVKLDTETCEPIALLQRMEGFDPSRIRNMK